MLEKLIRMLPSPMRPLNGKHARILPLPDNIICFSRKSAADLNRPQQGRALHHRFVLIFALQTGVTVRVDDHEVPLREGEGLLVHPFQFHDYSNAESEELTWLFITFDLVDDGSLQTLRNTPFKITSAMRQTASALVGIYLKSGTESDDQTTLLLSLLLSYIRRTTVATVPAPVPAIPPPQSIALMSKVNQLTEGHALPPSVKEMASSLGISVSHLRTRFRVSCGVTLGRHLRRLRLEKARGLLRLSTRRVCEIADLCGFSSVYTFSRAFHTAYGVAPLEYRKGALIKPGDSSHDTAHLEEKDAA